MRKTRGEISPLPQRNHLAIQSDHQDDKMMRKTSPNLQSTKKRCCAKKKKSWAWMFYPQCLTASTKSRYNLIQNIYDAVKRRGKIFPKFKSYLMEEKGQNCLFRGLIKSSGGKKKSFKSRWHSKNQREEKERVRVCRWSISLVIKEDRVTEGGGNCIWMTPPPTNSCH